MLKKLMNSRPGNDHPWRRDSIPFNKFKRWASKDDDIIRGYEILLYGSKYKSKRGSVIDPDSGVLFVDSDFDESNIDDLSSMSCVFEDEYYLSPDLGDSILDIIEDNKDKFNCSYLCV